MNTLAKTVSKSLIAVVAISAIATPAHAEISNPSTKKVVKVKSIKVKKAKFLTAANLETTTATPAPTTPATPAATPAPDANTVMMAKMLELLKTLMDSNAAALAALKQPANSVVVNPTITVNPTVTSTNTNQQLQAGNGSATLSAGAQPSISLGHNEGNENHR